MSGRRFATPVQLRRDEHAGNAQAANRSSIAEHAGNAHTAQRGSIASVVSITASIASVGSVASTALVTATPDQFLNKLKVIHTLNVVVQPVLQIVYKYYKGFPNSKKIKDHLIENYQIKESKFKKYFSRPMISSIENSSASGEEYDTPLLIECIRVLSRYYDPTGYEHKWKDENELEYKCQKLANMENNVFNSFIELYPSEMTTKMNSIELFIKDIFSKLKERFPSENSAICKDGEDIDDKIKHILANPLGNLEIKTCLDLVKVKVKKVFEKYNENKKSLLANNAIDEEKQKNIWRTMEYAAPDDMAGWVVRSLMTAVNTTEALPSSLRVLHLGLLVDPATGAAKDPGIANLIQHCPNLYLLGVHVRVDTITKDLPNLPNVYITSLYLSQLSDSRHIQWAMETVRKLQPCRGYFYRLYLPGCGLDLQQLRQLVEYLAVSGVYLPLRRCRRYGGLIVSSNHSSQDEKELRNFTENTLRCSLYWCQNDEEINKIFDVTIKNGLKGKPTKRSTTDGDVW